MQQQLEKLGCVFCTRKVHGVSELVCYVNLSTLKQLLGKYYDKYRQFLIWTHNNKTYVYNTETNELAFRKT